MKLNSKNRWIRAFPCGSTYDRHSVADLGRARLNFGAPAIAIGAGGEAAVRHVVSTGGVVLITVCHFRALVFKSENDDSFSL